MSSEERINETDADAKESETNETDTPAPSEQDHYVYETIIAEIGY
ncbi:hypothetical protein [Sulfurimonas sp. HSL3-7]